MGRYVGFGVDQYQDPAYETLEHAVDDVRSVHRLLSGSYVGEPLENPTWEQVWSLLHALPSSVEGESLVLMWSGHGVPASPVLGGLRLLTYDSGINASAGISVAEVIAPCAESGATQLLVILDTCFSGDGVAAATDAATAVLAARPPVGRFLWAGVLTSCLRAETARDGLFGRRLHAMIAAGPTDPELRRPWSPRNQFLRGDHICDALLREWHTDAQGLVFRSDGVPIGMIPNPLFNAGAPAVVVEHLLLAARGTADEQEGSQFTGRVGELGIVVSWVSGGSAGLRVVTGSAGTGKSAVLGRLVIASDSVERERLLRAAPLGHADPGEGSVTAHAHARGRTADQLANWLDDQLVRDGVLEEDPSGARNAAQLVGSVQKHAEHGHRPIVIAVDGLDEARGHAFTIARQLLVGLAAHATVIASTRDLVEPGDDPAGTLLAALQPNEVLDLDAEPWARSSLTAVRQYLTGRLVGRDPAMDASAIGEHFMQVANQKPEQPFLLARLVGDQLRANPLDTTTAGWQNHVADSIYAAVDADVDAVPTPRHRDLPNRTSAAAFARHLLTALTWGFGVGLPEEEWITTATVLSVDLGVGQVGPQDVTWVLEHLGRYVIQDGEDGVPVYRVAHQSLADHLRRPFTSTARQLFDPAATPVTLALLSRYHRLLAPIVRVS